MRRVYGHAKGLWVQLEQGFLPFGQVRAVLAQVLRGNHKQRLFVGIGVDWMLARALELHPRRGTQPLAAKCRDGAFGIAFLLGTDAGQILAQSGDLIGGGLGQSQPAVTVQNEGD